MQIHIVKHGQIGHFVKDHPIVTACRFDNDWSAPPRNFSRELKEQF